MLMSPIVAGVVMMPIMMRCSMMRMRRCNSDCDSMMRMRRWMLMSARVEMRRMMRGSSTMRMRRCDGNCNSMMRLRHPRIARMGVRIRPTSRRQLFMSCRRRPRFLGRRRCCRLGRRGGGQFPTACRSRDGTMHCELGVIGCGGVSSQVRGDVDVARLELGDFGVVIGALHGEFDAGVAEGGVVFFRGGGWCGLFGVWGCFVVFRVHFDIDCHGGRSGRRWES